MIRLFSGDNLELLGSLRDELDLVYVDPPFGVGVTHGARTKKGEARAERTSVAYDDEWSGIDNFMRAIELRIALFRERLSSRGTLYVHLDHRAVHETKVLCDRVFSRENFRGEIIWTPGNGARSKKSWGASHQTILVYSKTDDFIFHADAVREPYAATSSATHFKRGYRERTVMGKNGPKTYRYEASNGRRMGTVWTDVPSMLANTPILKETTGYPHQKPEKLLERVILASSDEGSLVGDFFCGSGTTLAVAARLGRRAIGCDASPLAIETTRSRLEKSGLSVSVTGAREMLASDGA